jgi:hypothetical protein
MNPTARVLDGYAMESLRRMPPALPNICKNRLGGETPPPLDFAGQIKGFTVFSCKILANIRPARALIDGMKDDFKCPSRGEENARFESLQALD